METLFDREYWLVWALLLGSALFLPVRRLIWVMLVRRAERRLGQPADDGERARLRRRAGMTAALLCYVFALLYTGQLFEGGP